MNWNYAKTYVRIVHRMVTEDEDMNDKSRCAFRIVLGGWLVYLGCSLLWQMYNERPSNMILMSAIAVVFVIVGTVCVGHSLKVLYDLRRPDGTNAEEASAEDADEPEAPGRGSGVQPVELAAPEETPEAKKNESPASETETAEELENDYEEK